MSEYFDATPLELLADEAGLGTEELREHLRGEIVRCSETLVCSDSLVCSAEPVAD